MIIKDSSNHIKKYKQIISAVHIVYRLVNSTPNLKELSLRLTRLLCQFVKASSASIFLLGPDREKLSMVAAFNNQINILLTQKKDLCNVKPKELAIAQGSSVFESRLMGMPLVTDECIGAIVIKRSRKEPPFNEFEREMFTVFAEQAVTAIRNLQFADEQQNILLETMRLVRKLLEQQAPHCRAHSPVYVKVVKRLAEKMHVRQEGINKLYYASILHNAGAADVPYQILTKKGSLTPDEFKLVRDMPKKSAALIRPFEFLRPILPIVLYLHERYDGSGYPSGLKEKEIPIGARIMSVVDAFESMVQGRPYRRKINIDTALKEIQENAGTQFDPEVVEQFIKLAQQRKFRNYLLELRS